MDRSTYYADPHVRGFLEWAAGVIQGDRLLNHKWESKKLGKGDFTRLSDGYYLFNWRFSVTIPGDSQPTRGESFAMNSDVLDRLSCILRKSAEDENAGEFLEAAIAIVKWGRVQHGNVPRLLKLGKHALPTILVAARQLDPARADLTRLTDVTHMNSSFSKIYALLLDDFPIYDSRVACALASLVVRY